MKFSVLMNKKYKDNFVLAGLHLMLNLERKFCFSNRSLSIKLVLVATGSSNNILMLSTVITDICYNSKVVCPPY